MAIEHKAWWMLSLLLLASCLPHRAIGEPQVPCYFIFGDSLFDNGNNNLLSTAAKANYEPYGVDFPAGPTGRFTNGRNMGDVIAQLLGFQRPIPPFISLTAIRELLKGVNYASGAAGIRDETGRTMGDRFTMNEQLRNHEFTILLIKRTLKSNASAVNYLNKCIYSVNMGNNDYINNYFLPQSYNTSTLYTEDQFAKVLADQYSKQLKRLYSYGARKVAIIGVGRLGCLPFILAQFGTTHGSSCVDKVNHAVQLFNAQLKPLVHSLNANLPGARFTYIDSYGIGGANPTTAGFTVTNASCCPVKSGESMCVPFGIPCSNRSQYVFYDKVHPTERINMLFGGRAYSPLLRTDAQPYSIRQLAQL